MAPKRLVILSTLLLAGLALADVQLESELLPEVDLEAADELAAEEDARDLRLVESPVTASRMADVIVNNIVNTLKRVGKAQSFMLPRSLSGSVPFDTDSGPKAIWFELSNVEYTNLGSISRSKAATFDAEKHRMMGTFMFEGLGVTADYKMNIPAVGIAPASTASGKVRSVADTHFVDYKFMTDANGLPLDILQWRSRKGKFTYVGETGMNNNKYKPIFEAVLKDGSVSALDSFVSRQLFNIFKRDIMGKMVLEK
ncbi:uncharacterized protein [Palaemon carinicauda]|uniref:uncharacterized protein n=1 Tax=Palaemon carinicauda TaxID=392227 RepID=UPI0035B5E988